MRRLLDSKILNNLECGFELDKEHPGMMKFNE
jgi:hypothetical protein